MRNFTAGKNDEGVRLNRFCEKICPTMPKNLLHKAFRNKRIKINGKKQEPTYRIQQGDLIEMYINDEFFTKDSLPLIKNSIDNINFGFSPEIIYEDENIAIIFKPLGVLCHSDNKNQHCLVQWFQHYLQSKSEFSPEKENTFTPALCNRLDQGTEGLVIAAKNVVALRDINTLIRENNITKQYLCLINGSIIDGEYSAFHSRNLTTKKVSIYSNSAQDAKPITTAFKTIDKKNTISLLECTLITGRTHQIRAHLAFLGHPIIGDKKYGKPASNLESQLLSSYKIHFHHIPENNCLYYLNDKTFISKNTYTEKYFNML